ncbi:MAG TPA: SpoIIE family protein phosphatase [Polyangiaceae bacterium]|nr:SpoIIE family protein phosphatase [Polyangiaceae bacterium]
MNLRTLLLASLALLIVAIVVPTVLAVATIVGRAAAASAMGDVARGSHVVDDLHESRQSLLRSEARVVAEEPRLKAVVATEDINHETILGVAAELRRALQSSIFLITDAEGRLLADVAEPGASGDDMSGDALIKGALEKGESSGLWTHDRELYAVHARRLAFGATTVGVLAVGYPIDDAWAARVASDTGSDIVVLDGDDITAASFIGPKARDGLGQTLAHLPPNPGTPIELMVGGSRYLAKLRPFPGKARAGVKLVILHSLDRALEPGRRLQRALFGIAALALVVAVAGAFVASRRVTQPFEDLLQVTRQVAGGDLSARASERGVVETRVLGRAVNRMVSEIAASQKQLAERQRLERELEIAVQIQTALLPRDIRVPGLEIAAGMLPADEVGGDYYDVIALEDGCFIGIGDVAGHGLRAGLIMLMVQSATAALTRLEHQTSPSALLAVLNEVLVDNVRARLRQDEHVTMSLVRYYAGGRIVYAGAHEEILVCRAETGRCETLRTPGPWMGVRAGAEDVLVDTDLALVQGDVLLLYTDGMIEERNEAREQFGIERLEAALVKHRTEPVTTIRDALMAEVVRFTHVAADDKSVVVIRYLGPSAATISRPVT